VIAVDLDAGVTRVLNSDYFGESKKGGLRMWNRKVYECGGLAMHAGCKVIPTSDGEKTMLIFGLSGSGSSTTTFTKQNGSQAVQVVVLLTPDPYLNVGQVYEHFPQVDDDEVLRCLQERRASTPR
jgi:predicted phosphoribosyltransferase